VYPDPDEELGEGVIYIVTFATDYPVLFECLYAVFGAMMSNSRLAEQIHGMMRSNLRGQVGMDQADHHRQFSAHQEYKMRRARREIADESGERRDKRKKALQHDKTLQQKVMIGSQLIALAAETEDMIANELDPEEVPTMSYWNERRGRRAQDKDNLATEIMYEDARASRLTRTPLTADRVRELARTMKPTNDATMEFNQTVLLWQEKVEAVMVGTFWDSVKPNTQYKQMWRLARKSFIFIDSLPFVETVKKTETGADGKKKSKRVMKLLHRKYEGVGGKMTCYNWGDNGSALYAKGLIYDIVTSKTRAKELVSSYIATTKKVTTHIYSFLKREDGSTIIDNKSVKKTDIYFLFVRYVEEAWGGDVIVPAVNAAFNTSRDVDPHFKYTVQDDAAIEEEDDASVNGDIDGTAAVTIEDNEGDMGDVDEDDIV
jgi:hypothetical protein